MEKRIANIIVGNAGGTAGKNSKTYKVALPSKWVGELNLDSEKIELGFDGEKITISRHLTFDEFIEHKKNSNHKLKLIKFYNKKKICTKICADFTDETIAVKNYTDNVVKTAFGRNELPSWQDFLSFLDERCVPESRSGIREYLEAIGVDAYDPIKIIEKTQGKMAEDEQWIELEEI